MKNIKEIEKRFNMESFIWEHDKYSFIEFVREIIKKEDLELIDKIFYLKGHEEPIVSVDKVKELKKEISG